MKTNLILKYIYVFCILSVNLLTSQAQNFLVNTGCFVSIPQGTKMHLNGSLINQNTGVFINEDSIYITGDITQSASNHLFQNNGLGTVLMIGNNQDIGGSSVPHFNNLSLKGTGVKSLDVDTRIKGILDLDDKELSTGSNTLFIDNTDTNAIIRTSGYISSDVSGFLQRSMAYKGNYLFPTGWTTGSTNKYRPIVINTPSSNPDTFEIRFVDHLATNDGFDVNNKENILCKINNNFYHHINRLPNNLSQVQLKFYFDTLTDGVFNRISHWQGIPQWQNTSLPSNITYSASPQLSEISIIKWNNFNPTPFALALSNPDPSILYVHPVCETSSAFNLTANTSGGSWSGTGITDPVNGTFNPQLTGPGVFTVYYDISNTYGCAATDSVSIIVEATPVASFTPTTNNADVNFINNSTFATSYYWDFGDGNYSNDVSPTHTYVLNGNYTVILYASNSCKTDSTYQIVNITNVGIEDNYLFNNISLYPNPFNNNSSISIIVDKESKISIDLYSATGKKISSIFENKLTEGHHIINLNAKEFNYVSGVYFLRIQLNESLITKRIVYIL